MDKKLHVRPNKTKITDIKQKLLLMSHDKSSSQECDLNRFNQNKFLKRSTFQEAVENSQTLLNYQAAWL